MTPRAIGIKPVVEAVRPGRVPAVEYLCSLSLGWNDRTREHDLPAYGAIDFRNHAGQPAVCPGHDYPKTEPADRVA